VFFARHGPKAVLFARWIPGLRLVGAWFAGAAEMPWRVFAVWNAIGGIAWAASIAGGAYLLGKAAGSAFGLIGVVVSVTLLIVVGAAVGRARLQCASSAADRASDSPQ
jgi:membrane-associated protein